MKSYPYILTLLTLLCSACADEPIMPTLSSEAIQFSASIGGSSSRSRSGGDDSTPQLYSLDIAAMTRSNPAADTLFLITEVTDWPVSAPSLSSSSRSTETVRDNFNDMMVSAYYYAESSWDPEIINDNAPNYINNARASRASADNTFSFDNPRFWPNEGNLRFLAFSPANYGSFKPSGGRAPAINLTVPSKVEDMRDLVVAYSRSVPHTQRGKTVPLNFKHALTAIRVKVMPEKDMVKCRIKKVEINNISLSGTFFFDNLAEEGESLPSASLGAPWYQLKYPPTDQVALETNVDITDAEQETYVVTGDNTFYMIPQTLGDNAELRITIQQIDDSGTLVQGEEVITNQLKGGLWQPGKLVTYVLSYDDWSHALQTSTLDPYPPIAEDENARCVAGQIFNLQSFYISKGDHQAKPAKWRASFSTDGGNSFSTVKPDWVDFTLADGTTPFDPTAEQPGSIDRASFMVHPLQMTTPSRTIDMDKAIFDQPEQGTEAAPYNLAHPSGYYDGTTACIRNTANCYIVKAPGWYLLPCVYGNAIKNGIDNKEAYAPSVGGGNVLSHFVNHRNEPIQTPYINDQPNCTGAKVNFMLQDVEYLIADEHPNGNTSEHCLIYKPEAYGGKGGILFHIPKTYYEWNWNPNKPRRNGNAKFALQDTNGNNLWSWHIWCTRLLDESLYNDPKYNHANLKLTNGYGTEFTTAMCYLGWVAYKPIAIYDERSCIMRITSTADQGKQKHKDILIKQVPLTKHWHGHTNYYQWGRPEFFFGSERDGTPCKRYDFAGYYYNSAPSYLHMGTGQTSLAQRIANPDKWHAVDEVNVSYGSFNTIEGYDRTFLNLWDAHCNHSWSVENEYEGTSVPTERPTVKSVYDPCPVGYKVPPLTTFSGFLPNGVVTSYDRRDWSGFYRHYTHNDPDHGALNTGVFSLFTNQEKLRFISFPLAGYNDWRVSGSVAGIMLQNGKAIYLWTSAPNGTSRAYYCNMSISDTGGWTSHHISVYDHYLHVDGCAILPCKE